MDQEKLSYDLQLNQSHNQPMSLWQPSHTTYKFTILLHSSITMPVTSDQVRRFCAIQKMKEIFIPLPPSLATLSFEEPYQVFKPDLPKYNFPMSYPQWIQAEKLRQYNPTAYDSWLTSCTSTTYFQPVPSIHTPESRKRSPSPLSVQETEIKQSVQDRIPPTSRKRHASPDIPHKMPKLTHFIDDILEAPFQPKTTSPIVDLDFNVDLDFEPITPLQVEDMIAASTSAEEIPKEQPARDTDTLYETIKSEFNTDSTLWTFI